jgi:hypothetical protein
MAVRPGKKWTDLSPPQMAAVDRVHVDEKTGEVRYRLPSLTTKQEASSIEAQAQVVEHPASDSAVSNPKPL